MVQFVKETIIKIRESKLLTSTDFDNAKQIFEQFDHVILSQGKEKITIQIENEKGENVVEVFEVDEKLYSKVNGSSVNWEVINLVALYVIEHNIVEGELSEGIKYTREGMRKRVLEERWDKARKANYKVRLADNLYGEHTLINEEGKSHKITLRDFKNKTGYINNIDWKTNKLGTTKHIMYLFDYLENNPSKVKLLKREYPFIEIYTDPLNDYKISWYYPQLLTPEEKKLITAYFGNKKSIEDSQITTFFSFINDSRDFQTIKIREEVLEKIENYFQNRELELMKSRIQLNFSSINASLYPYQKEGVEFAVFKKGVIVADEMGLGKTIQAIAAAILKKEIFNFKKTLVICPSSVKHQWKNEVLKFSNEQAVVVEGFPQERNGIYLKNDSYFHIINYETVLRDLTVINKSNYDFVILDEAQKIKNYETKTANAVKAIQKKHALIITGTPLENKLLDLYSIVQFLDNNFLTPQWEFSYQHCIFDSNQKNKIHGYYNLQQLKQRLSSILIRREKQEVFSQLPNVIQKDIFVQLSKEQAYKHAGFSRGIASILAKKFKTPYDWQKLMLLLTNMRMVCDSTYLIDKETYHSPKLIELRDILIEKIDIKNTHKKVIIFSEWVTMLNLIGDMLKKEGLVFTKLTGQVAVKKRGALIKEFEDNPDCNIFLSSESGGTGLNLQVADTVINFELPWNPAKKNQRIGRIDRIGQRKQTLHVFNLISIGSIEQGIAAGLLLKQSLFDGVLNSSNRTDEVNFSEKGKSQFIKQLESIILENNFSTEREMDNVIIEINEEDDFYKAVEPSNLQPDLNGKPTEIATNGTIVENPSHGLEANYEQMEKVMQQGMNFLSGMMKMATGSDLGFTEESIKVDKITGEVTMKFKLPTMV